MPIGDLPVSWREWLYMHVDEHSIYEMGYRYTRLIRLGDYGRYLTMPVLLFLVFVAVPRFRWGTPALSWCLFFMGVCLLPKLERGYSDGYLGVVAAVIAYARNLCFALSPLILGAVLQYPFVQQQLRQPKTEDAENV